MTEVEYTGRAVRVLFPGWESAMAGRASFTASNDVVRDAAAAPGWTSEILGMRSGLVVSGFRKLGVFTHPSGVRRLVSMKRGLPLLRILLDRAETGFDELLVSTPDADALARSIREGSDR
ncbi:hypothetical protein [Microbacterium resistens]|uniref:Uncharacterized protein n=1 Tax=Microbacterium resistens TaxID=156977 RepID=A0ABY3RTL3_9MICO|nr:hypothetical protein [Microbacterium resistens]UGS27299.1 hypothetical protein K8F61_03575 [Microbacterium resistens]